MNRIKDEFLQFLTQTCGCRKEDTFLLAVSGGIDSMVLMDLFHHHGLKYSVAHCNFQLRGKEADDDEEFVRQRASRDGIPFFCKQFNTLHYAEEKGISIQMAARDLRYDWFDKTARENALNFIVTAHHSDDSVETFLINLSRGTGISGLTGINPRTGNLIRPLLFAPRAEIRSYASEQNLAWREDSSNASDNYLRNRIRHKLLPEWNNLMPGVSDAILKTASFMRETKIILDSQVSRFLKEASRTKGDRIEIDIEKIRLFSSSEIILLEVIQSYGYNYTTVSQLIEALDGQPGKRFLSRTHEMIIDRSVVIIQPIQATPEDEVEVPQGTISVQYPVNLSFHEFARDESFTVPADNAIASIDSDRVKFSLVIRRWKEGDYFFPLGMKGRKKLSDFFVDLKIPLPDKKQVWIVESDGEIAWIIGLRIDERFKITESTKKILQIEYWEDRDKGRGKKSERE